MRVAWFTPVGAGPIADYSRGVLVEMLRLCEAHMFCVGPPDRFPAGVPAADLAAQPQALSSLDSFDAIFYNLGNDVQHAWIFDIARLHPGIVVLHEVTLHRLFLDYYLQHLRRPDLYIARMAEHYGVTGLISAHRILGPRLDPENARVEDDDRLRYTFTEEALRSATGAVVHSRWHGAIVRKLWSGSVCEAWLPAQRPSASSIAARTRRDERNGSRIRLMAVGPVGPHTHARDLVDVLAEDSNLAARTEYVIVGSYDPDDPYVRELSAKIVESGLAGSVRILRDLPPHEVDRCARAADVFINLRHPEDEGFSTALMYQLPFGKPVLTYDAGVCAEVPNEAVAKIAFGNGAELRRTLSELVDSAPRRQAIGAAGRRFAARHRARDYARQLLRFSEQVACAAGAKALAPVESCAVAERIATHIGETLSTLGATPDSPGVDAVIREAGALLWPLQPEPL